MYSIEVETAAAEEAAHHGVMRYSSSRCSKLTFRMAKHRWVLSRSCVIEHFSHYKRYLGRRPLARRREQARCETNLVWVYPAYKENEMKRIDALKGMIAWLVLLPLGAAAWAQDVGEGVRVEQVLTADQIDSSTVAVGAFVVIVYGQGERHPVSGAWTQLDTARGSIKAVDQQRLIVGLAPDGWSKWIALERIQTLRLTGAPFSGSADRDRTRTSTTKLVQSAQAEPEVARSDSLSEQMEAMVKRYDKKADNREALRIGKKVAAGVLGGVGFGLLGAAIAISEYEYQSNAGDDGIGSFFTPFFGFWGGNIAGTAIGVSAVDPQDNFLITLAGSALLGAGVPYAIAVISVETNSEAGDNLIILSGLLGPIVGATIASELSRKPLSFKKLEARRFSFGLVPDPKGGLSAIARLRF